MLREKLKWRPHESESTDAEHRGGATRSSEEVSVMGMERRGCVDRLYDLVNRLFCGRSRGVKRSRAVFPNEMWLRHLNE